MTCTARCTSASSQKECLSEAQNKAFTDSAHVCQQKLRQLNAMSNPGAIKAHLDSHGIGFLILEEQKQAWNRNQKQLIQNVFRTLRRHLPAFSKNITIHFSHN